MFGTLTKYCRAQARLEAADTKTEPSLQSLTIVKSIDLICHLWQQYVNIALLPLASSSVTIRREMVVFNNQTINRIETSTNNLLQRIADGMYFFDNSHIDTYISDDCELAQSLLDGCRPNSQNRNETTSSPATMIYHLQG